MPIKILFYFWGVIGMMAHALYKAQAPGISGVWDYYKVNNKGVVFSFLTYSFIYGIWAAMGRWAPAIGWLSWVPYANPWLGVFSVVGGYCSDSLWNNIVKKAEAKANGTGG